MDTYTDKQLPRLMLAAMATLLLGFAVFNYRHMRYDLSILEGLILICMPFAWSRLTYRHQSRLENSQGHIDAMQLECSLSTRMVYKNGAPDYIEGMITDKTEHLQLLRDLQQGCAHLLAYNRQDDHLAAEDRDSGTGIAPAERDKHVRHKTILSKPASITQASTDYSALHDMKLLLVEDDPIARYLVTEQMQEAGLAFEVAENGIIAWHKLQTDDYDLLLTDINMPVLDGIELTQRIRQHEQEQGCKHLLIIGLSAHALDEVSRECLAAGMDDFMPKPVHPDILMQHLQHLTHAKTRQP